jgi:hypothetical protein
MEVKADHLLVREAEVIPPDHLDRLDWATKTPARVVPEALEIAALKQEHDVVALIERAVLVVVGAQHALCRDAREVDPHPEALSPARAESILDALQGG